MQAKYIFLTIVNSGLLILGQTLWKFGLIRTNGFSLKLLLNPLILLGVLVYGLSTLLWFYILSRLPFSTAYPLNSVAYAFSLFVGYFFFREEISLQKIFGTILILAGVFYITKG
jgi:drug/metabolite transporter (DMT)-like permease